MKLEQKRWVIRMNYDRQLARRALEIKAIKLWPKEGPFLWASGFHMPIYNDNRMFLGKHSDRMLVTDALVNTIAEAGLEFDMIGGTSTAGIAPAASVAQRVGAPMVIQHGGEAYVFEPGVVAKEMGLEEAVTDNDEVVVSTCPFGIPGGVFTGNSAELPFAYVRAEKKDHGMKKAVEGILHPGERVLLLDYHMGDGYFDIAKQVLEEAGVEVSGAFSRDVSDLLVPADVSGKKILQVEDLISTGGSCVKEVVAYRDMGAEVTDVVAIFSYMLDAAQEKFSNAGLAVHPGFTYPVLLEEAVASDYIPQDSKAVLDEWRSAPFDWGEKNGYPAVKK